MMEMCTYSTESNGQGTMLIDAVCVGKGSDKMYKSYTGLNGALRFIDSNGSIISQITVAYDKVMIICIQFENAVKMDIYCNGGYMQVYEISPSNEPTFSLQNNYMLLHANPLNQS